MKIYAKSTFKQQRAIKGLTLAQLAKKVQYTTSGLSKVERRANGLKADRAYKIAEVLEKEFRDIFEFVE